MHAVAIRASGGCSGYMDVHDPELTKDLGKILYKKKDNEQVTRIKHPMFTGLQKDLDSGGYIPEWTIKTITWQDGDKVILKAVTNISISQDPYIKFTYDGDVTVSATDTKGNEFTQ
jgi:sulfur-oxidizing protein SoxY